MNIVDATDLPETFVRALYGLGSDVVVWSRPDAIAAANNRPSRRKDATAKHIAPLNTQPAADLSRHVQH
jgi:hypothetical protein